MISLGNMLQRKCFSQIFSKMLQRPSERMRDKEKVFFRVWHTPPHRQMMAQFHCYFFALSYSLYMTREVSQQPVSHRRANSDVNEEEEKYGPSVKWNKFSIPSFPTFLLFSLSFYVEIFSLSQILLTDVDQHFIE